MNGLIKIMLGAGVVITVCCVLAVALIPSVPQESARVRHEQAQRMIDNLTMGIWNYFEDHQEFPPGDGNGSSRLVRALRDGDRPYFSFVPDMLTEGGDLRSPIDPERDFFQYRNNFSFGYSVFSEPRYHNKSTFDLWCRDSDGRPDGINNWE